MRKNMVFYLILSVCFLTGLGAIFTVSRSHQPVVSKQAPIEKSKGLAPDSRNKHSLTPARQSTPTVENSPVAGQAQAGQPVVVLSETIDDIRAQYGDRISTPQGKVEFLRELKRFIAKSYLPGEREAFFKQIIRSVFPELADEILALSSKLDAYYSWLDDQTAYFGSLNDAERDDLAWEKRYELFGEDTKQIFAGLLRKRIVKKALTEIEHDQQGSLDDKLDAYLYAIEDAYPEHLDAYLSQKKQSVLQVFFKLSSVQEELRQMTAEERKTAIRMIRKDLGMGDKDLDRSEQIDHLRAEAWQSGQTYLQQRKEVVDKYDGPDRNTRLDELRRKYWGSRAEDVKIEEQAGFFRYQKQRIFGIN